MANQRDQSGTAAREKIREELKEPDLYKVILHNDHYTSQEFVVEVLRTVFNKGLPEATKIMLDVHRRGHGVVGSYSYDIARTKVQRVRDLARDNEYPLKCTMEKI